MPLDHYVSQVHLKQFFSPALGEMMHGTKKLDLKYFPCTSRSVCRIEGGSTNAYLVNDRAIEEFLRGVEPKYDPALAALRRRELNREIIATFAGFAAYVACCAPAAMRIHSGPLAGAVALEAAILDRQALMAKAPASLGNKTLSELLADGTVSVNVDGKFPQAIGINSIAERASQWGNSQWEVIVNSHGDCPFFSSDYPIALEATTERLANWIVPLAPDLAIRIIPDISMARAAPDPSFAKFRCRYRTPGRAEIVEINRFIVRCAEEMVFYRDALPWVRNFIEKNRHYRVEAVIDRFPIGTGFANISTQRIMPYRAGKQAGAS